MDEEYLKRKYRYLYNNVYNIKSKLTNLNTDFNELKNSIEDAISIDDNIPGIDSLNTINKDTKNITNELYGTILPRISYKMY